MKLLLDQGIPHSAAALLLGMGLDVIHVGEIDMEAVEDEAIIEYARALWSVRPLGRPTQNSTPQSA